MPRRFLVLTAMLVTACSSQPPAAMEQPSGHNTRLPGAPEAVFGALVLNLSPSESLLALDVPVADHQAQLMLYATDDAGASWTRTLAVDGVFAAWAHHDSEVWLASHIQRAGVTPELRRSGDAGKSWMFVDVESTVGEPSSMVRYEELRASADGVVLKRDGEWVKSADVGSSWDVASEGAMEEAARVVRPCRVGVDAGVLSLACDAGSGWERRARFVVFRP